MTKQEASQYQVRFTTGAKKVLKSKECKPHVVEILKHVQALQGDPFSGEPLEGSLLKVRSLHFTLRGSGQWRVAYYVMVDERFCLILAIGPRENFYQKVKNRYDALKKSTRKN